jgi:phosphoribosylanthranilate isomerase
MTAKVKICGLKTDATVAAAIEAGADYIGLVLFPKSPRDLTIEEAAKLVRVARASADGQRVKIVTLLVDPDDALLDRVTAEIAPDILQLHGHETLARTAAIRQRTNTPVMKAISVETMTDVSNGLSYASAADMLLFDARPPKDAVLPGGNGLAFDWRLLTGLKGRTDYMLAGGLTPDNVAAAIQLTGAPAVDVSSGVETSPGVKDITLIQRFIAAAKAAKS